jgi:hypothetical protein
MGGQTASQDPQKELGPPSQPEPEPEFWQTSGSSGASGPSNSLPAEDMDGNAPVTIHNMKRKAGAKDPRANRLCGLCSAIYVGFGHNAYPVDEHCRCCDHCNRTIVIPARLNRATLPLQGAESHSTAMLGEGPRRVSASHGEVCLENDRHLRKRQKMALIDVQPPYCTRTPTLRRIGNGTLRPLRQPTSIRLLSRPGDPSGFPSLL